MGRMAGYGTPSHGCWRRPIRTSAGSDQFGANKLFSSLLGPKTEGAKLPSMKDQCRLATRCHGEAGFPTWFAPPTRNSCLSPTIACRQDHHCLPLCMRYANPSAKKPHHFRMFLGSKWLNSNTGYSLPGETMPPFFRDSRRYDPCTVKACAIGFVALARSGLLCTHAGSETAFPYADYAARGLIQGGYGGEISRWRGRGKVASASVV
jgi:hypothetical protein